MDTPTLSNFIPGATTSVLASQWEDGWYPCNPSIAHGDEGYAVIITHRDLVRHDDGTHSFADASGVIRTRNFFARLDTSTLALVEPLRELDGPPGPIVNDRVLGVEDPRLYWNQEWRYSGTIAQHHISGEQRMALCTVYGGLHEIVPAPDGTRVKNLMPTGGEPAFIDIKEQRNDLHGGAVVRFGDGYLGIAHDIFWPGRVYRHYFTRFDGAGTLCKVSGPFTFGGIAIEFASGIVLHHNDLVVSYGVQDFEARLARVPLDKVLETL